MKKAILCISAMFVFGSPAYAQIRFNSQARNPNPTMIRVPPSGQLGAGLSDPLTASTAPKYPAPIRRDYDPTFPDPTDRNPDLRKH